MDAFAWRFHFFLSLRPPFDPVDHTGRPACRVKRIILILKSSKGLNLDSPIVWSKEIGAVVLAL